MTPPLVDRYEAALEAIVQLGKDDRQAYLYDPAFHAAVVIARNALALEDKGQAAAES